MSCSPKADETARRQHHHLGALTAIAQRIAKDRAGSNLPSAWPAAALARKGAGPREVQCPGQGRLRVVQGVSAHR